MKKDLFIHSINLIEVDNDFNIPTCVTYDDKKQAIIGKKAITNHEDLTVAENFKLDIGNIDTKAKKNSNFIDFGSVKKSSIQITSDFFREIFKVIKLWLENNSLSASPNLLIAEPLSLQTKSGLATEDWLKKYRKNLTSLLSGNFFGIDNISFMPKPFAVFQYY